MTEQTKQREVIICQAEINGPPGWEPWMSCFGIEQETLAVWLPINLHPDGIAKGLLAASFDGERIATDKGLHFVRGSWLMGEVPETEKPGLRAAMGVMERAAKRWCSILPEQ
jgi:hypothetical protein